MGFFVLLAPCKYQQMSPRFPLAFFSKVAVLVNLGYLVSTLFLFITNLIKMEIHSYFRPKFRIKIGFTIKSRIGTTDGFFQEMEVSIVKFC